MTKRADWEYTVQRDGRWWLITVPELGLVTQARQLGEIETMARSIIALHLGRDPGCVHVVRRAPVAVSATAQDLIQRADELARLAALAPAAKAEAAWWLVRKEGLTQRDAGQLLGVSHQRVAQLVADEDARAS